MVQCSTGPAQPETNRTMKKPDDSTLLRNIAHSRDPALFSELFSRYQSRAYSLAFHLTRDRELAQDAVQEAMLAVWLHAAAFRPGNATGWIMRIVANKSLKLTRQRQKEDRPAREPGFERRPARGSEPPDLVADQELLQILRESLAQLPHSEGQVLVLRFLGGLTQAEIGELLSLSQAAIGLRLEKACARVRARLEQGGHLAVLPLVSATGLVAAYAAEIEVPPGLRGRVLEGLARATRTPRAHPPAPLRTGAGQARSLAPLAGGLALAIAAAGLGAGAFFQGPGIQKTPGALPSRGAAAPSPVRSGEGDRGAGRVAVRPFYRRWTFEMGPPADIEVREGRWRWDGRKSMVAEGPATTLLLPNPLPPQPFLLRTRLEATGRAVSRNGAHWCDADRMLPYQRWSPGPLTHSLSRQPIPYREYFIGAYSVVYRAEELVAIVQDTATPSSRLCLSLYGMAVEEIVLQGLETDELPAGLNDPPALITRLGWPTRKIGAQPFR